jgi:1-acyl-sn-glycerol-3-phosphate acyltransferase
MPGGFILAANHLSPFDVPLLIRHCPRPIDFMSVVEMRANPWVTRFFGLFNTFYLDRARRDPTTVLVAVRRLKQGRIVGMFPEGRLRPMADSVIHGGAIRPGVASIARMANVPIVPCVVLGSSRFLRVPAWLPGSRTRYGVIFGKPLNLRPDTDETSAEEKLLDELRHAYRELSEELIAALRWRDAAGS